MRKDEVECGQSQEAESTFRLLLQGPAEGTLAPVHERLT